MKPYQLPPKPTPPSFPVYQNKIMNNNIVSTTKNHLIMNPPVAPSPALAPKVFVSNPDIGYQPKSTSDLFGDFEQNFLEANLDKVISLEELKSIAEAISQRDWGYVKYILTIICLILKSYQNISQHTDESILSKKPQRPQSYALRSETRRAPLNGQSGLKLIIPEKRKPFRKESDSSRETKAFKQEEINDQLMNLNKIFKKMKNAEVQNKLSNCWSCQNNICSIHGPKTDLSGAPKFEEFSGVRSQTHKSQAQGFGFSIRADSRMS
jgi:hypothetical protein